MKLGPSLFSYLCRCRRFKAGTACDFVAAWKGEGGGKTGGENSGFFLLKLEERLHSFPQVPWIENVAFCAVPRNVAFAMNTALLIAPTRAHTKRDGYARPFPARPCRCSRNSRVGLSGKQTARGCWESSPGLQITVRLTRVSEPAPLLPHTYMRCIYTPTRARCVAHTKGAIEAHIQLASNGSLSAPHLSQELRIL